MNIAAIESFLKNSGMRKVGSGLYMFSSLLLARVLSGITADEFKPLALTIIVALMAANAYEHKKKADGAKNEDPAA